MLPEAAAPPPEEDAPTSAAVRSYLSSTVTPTILSALLEMERLECAAAPTLLYFFAAMDD